MTGITKDELMQMARDAGLIDFYNAILERAAVQMKEESAKINWCTTGEWGEGWCCGAQDALDGAEVAIRALKINTGD